MQRPTSSPACHSAGITTVFAGSQRRAGEAVACHSDNNYSESVKSRILLSNVLHDTLEQMDVQAEYSHQGVSFRRLFRVSLATLQKRGQQHEGPATTPAAMMLLCWSDHRLDWAVVADSGVASSAEIPHHPDIVLTSKSADHDGSRTARVYRRELEQGAGRMVGVVEPNTQGAKQREVPTVVGADDKEAVCGVSG
mmetsp:Transcript_23620/g.62257  ORF Transcript_23620/g.62257 Transcript_23620/m.62257 type:complete len:195 (-) Transcript_23620:610-1194(-)